MKQEKVLIKECVEIPNVLKKGLKKKKKKSTVLQPSQGNERFEGLKVKLLKQY